MSLTQLPVQMPPTPPPGHSKHKQLDRAFARVKELEEQLASVRQAQQVLADVSKGVPAPRPGMHLSAALDLDNSRAALLHRLTSAFVKRAVEMVDHYEADIAQDRLSPSNAASHARITWKQEQLQQWMQDRRVGQEIIREIEKKHPWLMPKPDGTLLQRINAGQLKSDQEIARLKEENKALMRNPDGVRPQRVNGHTIYADEVHLCWVIMDNKTGLIRQTVAQESALNIALSHTAGDRKDGPWGQAVP